MGARTSIIEYSPFRPVFDYLRKRPYSLINLDICLDHTRILESQWVVDIQVARQLQFRIPHFDDRNLRSCSTLNFLHAICQTGELNHTTTEWSKANIRR